MAYIQTTRATMRQRVRERLITQFWSDAELNSYINEALRVWNVCTGYARNIYTNQVLAAGVFGYAVPGTNTMFILRVEVLNNPLYPIWPITLKELQDLDQTWTTRTTTGTPTNWMQLGANTFYLYPTVANTSSPIIVNIHTLDTFQVPLTDNDFVQVGEEDLQYVIDYSVFMARLKEGGKEAMESVALLSGFLQQAAKYNSKLLQTSLYRRVLGSRTSDQTRNPKTQTPTVR